MQQTQTVDLTEKQYRRSVELTAFIEKFLKWPKKKQKKTAEDLD